jgi:Domain of unknown function (DUF4412)
MKDKKSAIAVLAVLLLLVLGGRAVADLYIESEQTSRGMPGRPDCTAVLKQYFTADAVMLDLGDRLTIMNFKNQTFYELDKASKTYTSGRLDQMGLDGIGIDTQGIEQNGLLNSMMQAMVQSATVTPTAEVRTIAGYSCRKYWVHLLMTESVYWTSKDIQGYPEIKALAERSTEAFRNNPLLAQMNILGLVRELDGYPVQTITYMLGGGSITTMLKKAECKKFAPGLFRVPEGYRLVRQR